MRFLPRTAAAPLAAAVLLAGPGCASAPPKLTFDSSVPVETQTKIQKELDVLYATDSPSPQDVDDFMKKISADKQEARDAIVPIMVFMDENYDFTGGQNPGLREGNIQEGMLEMGPVEKPEQIKQLKDLFLATSYFSTPQPATRRIALRLLVQAGQMKPENLVNYFGIMDDGFLKQEIVDLYVFQAKDNPDLYTPALDKVIDAYKNPSAVYDALMAYGKLDKLKALYVALKLFDSKDDIVYKAAFSVLANSGSLVSQIDEKTLHSLLDKLIQGLNRGGGDTETVALAMQTLEKTGILTADNVHALIPFIQKGITVTKGKVQPDAEIGLVHLLGLAGPVSKEAVPLLLSIAADKGYHYYLRLQAVHSLGEILRGSGDMAVVTQLQTILASEDSQQMQDALNDAIGKTKGTVTA